MKRGYQKKNEAIFISADKLFLIIGINILALVLMIIFTSPVEIWARVTFFVLFFSLMFLLFFSIFKKTLLSFHLALYVIIIALFQVFGLLNILTLLFFTGFFLLLIKLLSKDS